MKQLKIETKQKIIKLSIIIFVFIILALAIYLPLQLTGTLAKIDSAEKLKEVILEFGAYSYIIFFIIQFLQTTILPIPAAVTTVAGTLLFGPWTTFGISLLAVLSGSLFAFFLGKKIGRRLVVWVAGEKTTLKWEEKLKKGKYVFFLMMLFPLFPDDILCIVAGTVNMSYRFFIITNLITRPIAIITTCFLGSGQLIPFSGWGIPVWIILVILAIIILYLSFKYQPQIEKFVVSLGVKFTNKKQKKEKQINLIEYTENKENIMVTKIDKENTSAPLLDQNNKNIVESNLSDTTTKNQNQISQNTSQTQNINQEIEPNSQTNQNTKNE